MHRGVALLGAARRWLRAHDPGYGALRRAGRAAILMPGLLAFTDKVIANPTMSYFVAFGSFAMLLLVDFPGSIADRLRAQATLGVACAVLISLGTLASRSTPVAVIAMGVVGFIVIFSGVVSSVLAGATTALLLSFILPVSLAGPASQIPDRVAGWGLAAAVSLLAITLLWPAPVRNPVRSGAIDACRAIGRRLVAEVAFVCSAGGEDDYAAYQAAIDAGEQAVSRLYTLFFATPYRPTGLATDARAIVRLVDELRWLNGLVLRSAPKHHPRAPNRDVCAVKVGAGEVLSSAADLLEHPAGSCQPLHDAVTRMRDALAALERSTTTRLPVDEADGTAAESPQAVISALDPSFRAQELSFVTGQIASNVEYAAAAQRRSFLARLLGRQPEGFTGPLTSLQERAGAHVRWSSSWLQNSLRGAVALAMAVLVADVTTVQHGFWVVFGTLAVLRSNALSTGQNIVRAIVGTTAGFAVGGVLVYLIGTNTVLLWVILPLVVLFAGLAPAAISFAAGQASFTLTLLVLFNLLVPVGWKIGLLRIEDVAIGCGVSLVVGLLMWPRGAATALGRALSDAYLQSVAYLSGAVDYAVGRCDRSATDSPPPRDQALAAAASSRRLDDTYRGYLSERGAKPIAMADVTSLVTGVAGVRLAADAVLELWDGDARSGDRSAARRELARAAEEVTGWYSAFAASLAGATGVPDPLAADEVADGRLLEAVAHDLRDAAGHATATGVKVLWTGDHLDAVRRLEATLAPPAQAAVEQHALRPEDELVGALRRGLIRATPA